MFELIVERHFSAAHCLREYDGACARVHGHNYRVEVAVTAPELSPLGFVMDFGDLKSLCDAVLGEMDHRMLNELEAFTHRNATSENIARHIYMQMKSRLEGGPATIKHVRVWETPEQSAIYREE
ncbi:MAG: 6-carboxytetrahydropterin synthase QueD [Armatimonadetes bacterium]|nr:6-carboxytetrahydropterin synthase QueD [Armatimonadota bacterium]